MTKRSICISKTALITLLALSAGCSGPTAQSAASRTGEGSANAPSTELAIDDGMTTSSGNRSGTSISNGNAQQTMLQAPTDGGETLEMDTMTTSDGRDEPLVADDACGEGSVAAELTPVNMLVMFDRSGSMNDDNKWPSATAALTAFFQNPGADGLRVALRFFPHDEPAMGCSEGSCDAMACAQPLVSIGTLSAEPAPTDSHEEQLVRAIANVLPGGRGGRGGGGGGQGTPIYAALDGALIWASSHKAMHPDETTVVVFVTDGEPNGCIENFDDIASLAAQALATSAINTYAIGLEGSNQAQMNQLAAAGGTDAGIFIGTGATAEQELLDALNAIRGETLSCDFPVPEAKDASLEVDPSRLNVTFTDGQGKAATFRKVETHGDCADLGAWYYDDLSAPTRIHLCPRACEAVQSDPGAQIEILIGCTTCGGLDKFCDEGTPPEVPPLF